MDEPSGPPEPALGAESAQSDAPPFEQASPNPLARDAPEDLPAPVPRAADPDATADRYADTPPTAPVRAPWEAADPDNAAPPDEELFAGLAAQSADQTQEPAAAAAPQPSDPAPADMIDSILDGLEPSEPPAAEAPPQEPPPTEAPAAEPPPAVADRYAPTPAPAATPPAPAEAAAETPPQTASDPPPFKFPWDEDPPAAPSAPAAEVVEATPKPEAPSLADPVEGDPVEGGPAVAPPILPPPAASPPVELPPPTAPSDAGKTRSVSISVANTRRMAWALGGKIGVAYLPALGADNDPQSRWEIEALCEALGLPSSVGDAEAVTAPKSAQPGSDTSITQLLAAGRTVGAELAQKHGRAHAALLEAALKSTAAVSLCASRPDLNKPLAGAIEKACGRAGIPDPMWRPLVDDLNTGAPPDKVRQDADAMYARVGDWLDTGT
ncbi:hypothetical protein Pla175_43060 [Pirellulimonas nuda]|uniref:Uncharacterized protein n=2 Tax=Pirellulimonas nuda TaxID=2528009 RepID=A0A518DHD8_9BACT|nr:hypothetical protein Pla175_43060 [Pirellulimonas nuda]